MEGISDIYISGIDRKRQPRIRKEPYIELFFQLSHKAPRRWCEDFNNLVAKGAYSVRISPGEGEFIETWVRKPQEIEAVLETLKATVAACNSAFIARAEAEQRAALGRSANPEDEGEQGKLNRIIEALDFSPPDT